MINYYFTPVLWTSDPLQPGGCKLFVLLSILEMFAILFIYFILLLFFLLATKVSNTRC